MRCAQVTEFAKPIEIVEAPDPTLPPGGVIVEVMAAGLCRSDWHAWQGHDSDIKSLPHIPGHEFAGIIIETAKGVSNWNAGDRVTAPFACGCGTCPDCSSGNSQVCPDQYQPGFSGPGAFAQRVALPHADHNLVKLPDDVGFAEAASLGCRFATAFRALVHADQAAVQPGETVAVFGCGGVGLSAIMIASAIGAEVIAIDIQPSALDQAKSLGAAHTLQASNFAELKELTGGRGVDVSVDAVGSTTTCVTAIESLAPRGRHVQIGLMFGNDAFPQLPMGPIIAKELRIIGSHGMAASRYPEMLAMMSSGKLTPAHLIANSISLSELPDAMNAMSTFTGLPGITLIEQFD